MTAPKCVGCPFRRDCPDCPWSGEIPAATTVSDARTGGECATMEPYSQTCETPASTGIDRGRGPTSEESSKMDRTPQRIQRKRTKGWKMPPGAVYVGRPTRWGNPFQVLQRPCGCWDVEDENGVTYLLATDRHGLSGCSGTIPKRLAARDSVDLFAALYLGGRLIEERSVDDLTPLRGKDLACWCPLEDATGNRFPCHADVLLVLANGGER